MFFLVKEGHLPAPFLYLSAYFEAHKNDYYDRLQAVREKGEVQEWLQYFLRAVQVQANDAVIRAELLTDLREECRQRLRGTRSRAYEVVDMLMDNPIITTSSVASRLQVTSQGSTNLPRQLETAGVLTALQRVPGRSNRWVAQEILDGLTSQELDRVDRNFEWTGQATIRTFRP